MQNSPNLLFIWTDQQAKNTLGAYGNEHIQTPNIDELADESVIFDRAHVSQPSCGPSRSTVMTGLYPHVSRCIENNVSLPPDIDCFPEMGNLDHYTTGFIGKWHLCDEIFAQHGFDEWIAIEDAYRSYYSKERDKSDHSSYHNFLIQNGFEPDIELEDGFKQFSRQFCATLDEEYTKAAFLGREASRFIKEHEDDPFILHVMFLEPHPPYTSPRDSQYNPTDVKLPPNFDHEGFDDQPLRIRLMREAIRHGSINRQPSYWNGEPSESDWRQLISQYWGLASLVDTQVGTILETLSDCGVTDNTIIAYTSDHGDMMGSQGLLAKFSLFEESIGVPLILRIPDAKHNGTRVKTPVSQVDLVPTLLDAMDQPIPDHLHGSSWYPYLAGDRDIEAIEKNVFVMRNGINAIGMADGRVGGTRPTMQSNVVETWMKMASKEEILACMTEPVRTVITPDGWKLNYRRSSEHELYNIANDPYEMTNVAATGTHNDLIKDLSNRIFEWQDRIRDPVYLY